MTEEREDIVVLVDENGEEVEFEHLDTIEMNDNNYVVLLPLDEADEDEGEVVILRVEEGEDGEDTLVVVEDEDELNEVFELFKMRMEDEFDFIDDEDFDLDLDEDYYDDEE
ncbi:MAG: DUF1292 domain-containing protein [Clostridiaceae bacterium]|nr:DUF1292 domain-containing protein [Clostridiaceae bacterium]